MSADIVELLRRERAAILGCLGRLEPLDWQRRTPCPDWRVHDLVGHLWGVDLAFLARLRDGWDPGPAGAGAAARGGAGGAARSAGVRSAPGGGARTSADAGGDRDRLTAAIDAHNARWVQACRVVSPGQLLAGLRTTGAEMAVYLGHTDLTAPAEVVAWAGAGVAPLALCAARELSERFVHQDQLRRALDQPSFADEDVVAGVVDAMVLAVPVGLSGRASAAPAGTVVEIGVGGAVRRRWRFAFDGARWEATRDAAATPAASLRADALDLIRLWSGGLSPGQQVARIELTGEPRLYAALRDTRAAHVTT